MPSGDRHRTWFPEMVEALRREWCSELSWYALLQLRDRLDADLQRIRTERRLHPPMMNCRACGKRHPAAPPRVSVRAMILALGNFGVAPVPEVKELERQWNRYRRANALDLYGRPEKRAADH
jgi:hypothetical protein